MSSYFLYFLLLNLVFLYCQLDFKKKEKKIIKIIFYLLKEAEELIDKRSRFHVQKDQLKEECELSRDLSPLASSPNSDSANIKFNVNSNSSQAPATANTSGVNKGTILEKVNK